MDSLSCIVFQIPKPRIPDCTSKNVPDSLTRGNVHNRGKLLIIIIIIIIIIIALFTFLHILSHFSVHHIFIYHNLFLTYLC